jgi:hypothetical protein
MKSHGAGVAHRARGCRALPAVPHVHIRDPQLALFARSTTPRKLTLKIGSDRRGHSGLK